MKRFIIGILCLLAMTCFGQITTKNVVPNTNNTGWIGITNKKWQGMMSYTGKFDYLFGNGAGLSNLPAGTGAVSSVTLLSSNTATLLIASNGITGYVTNWLSVIGSSTDTNTVLVLASNMAMALDDGVLQSSTNYANTILQSATNYADSKDILVLQSSTNYANTILQSATNYADSKDILVLQSSTNYADAQDILVLQSATNYADSVAGRGESNASYILVRSTNSLPNALGLFNDATNLIPQMFKVSDWLWRTNSGSGFTTSIEDGGGEDWRFVIDTVGDINVWNTNEIPNGIYRILVTAIMPTNSEAWMYSGNMIMKHWTNNPTVPYTNTFNGFIRAGGRSNIWFRLGQNDPVATLQMNLAINTNETKLVIRDGDNQTLYGTTRIDGMLAGNIGIGTNTMQSPTNVPAVLTVAGTNTPVLFAVSHGGGSGSSNLFTVSANGNVTNRGTFYNTASDIYASSIIDATTGSYLWAGKLGGINQIKDRQIAINSITNLVLGGPAGFNTPVSTITPMFEMWTNLSPPLLVLTTATNRLRTDFAIMGDLYLTNPVAAKFIQQGPGGQVAQGAFGCLGIKNVSLVIATQDVYTTLTGYTHCRTNWFLGSAANGTLTNLLEGFYKFGITCSFAGAANTHYEVALFTNGVECSDVEFNRKLGAGGDVGSAAGGSIVYLPANTPLEVRAKDITGTSTLNFTNFSLTVSSP